MKNMEKNIINLYGEEGREWLAKLPQLIKQIEKDYSLSHLKPFENSSFNYLLSGFQESQPIVLKLSLDVNSLKQEALMLKAYDGLGAVKILVGNDRLLLLERAVPGITLKSYFPDKDDEAIEILCKCLKSLHQAVIPEDHPFPHIQVWLKSLNNNLAIPVDYLHKARKLRDELILTSVAPVLLHGDLHHDNILQNGKDWVVIDPKGVIGEPAYEIAAFIRNPMPELLALSNASDIIDNRINQFAKTLKLSKQRIINWCYVQAVLAWSWGLEDNCDVTCFKKITELFKGHL